MFSTLGVRRAHGVGGGGGLLGKEQAGAAPRPARRRALPAPTHQPAAHQLYRLCESVPRKTMMIAPRGRE